MLALRDGNPSKITSRAVPSAKNKKKNFTVSRRDVKRKYPKGSRKLSITAKAIQEAIPMVAALRERLKADPHDLLDAQALSRSMIKSFFQGRGETISVWLSDGPITVQSSAGAVIALAYSAQLSNCAGYAEWITIFGTYRLKRAAFHYTPFFKGTGTNTGVCVGGVRYGNNVSSPVTFSEAQQLDESKVFPLTDKESWAADFSSGYSDYIAISSPSTVYASLDLYSFSGSGVGISTSYGVMTGKILVEFEGLL